MNAAFGIDHPLIAVDDLAALRERLISLGFNMTTVGKHPWGTSTSLAMFEGCLLEIMSIYDEALLDEVAAGDFCFGRHIHRYLQEREGVALTALHSLDSLADAAFADAAGFSVSGHLQFGREVLLPDGKSERTHTTLALMPDRLWPRLSMFLCQQHRPELIYVPQWLRHKNSVFGFAAVTVRIAKADKYALIAKFRKLYGKPEAVEGGVVFKTANGEMRLLSDQVIEACYTRLPAVVLASGEPCIVGIDLKYADRQTLETCLENSGVAFIRRGEAFCLDEPTASGNTFLKFVRG